MANEEKTSIASITIVLIVLLILITWGTSTVMDTSKAHDRKCQSSINTYAKLIDGLSEVSHGDAQRVAEESIDCPTNRVELKGSDAAIKKVIAEDLVQCWKNYGEGELQLFRGEGTFCSVCSLYEFSDDDGQLNGLPLYLQATQVPREEFTYAEYLAGVGNNPEAEVSERISEQNFEGGSMDRSKQYGSILYYVKGNTPWEHTQNFFSSTEGRIMAGGAVILNVIGGPTALIRAGLVFILFDDVDDASFGIYDYRLDYGAFVSLEEFSAENINSRCDIIAVKVIEE